MESDISYEWIRRFEWTTIKINDNMKNDISSLERQKWKATFGVRRGHNAYDVSQDIGQGEGHGT